MFLLSALALKYFLIEYGLKTRTLSLRRHRHFVWRPSTLSDLAIGSFFQLNHFGMSQHFFPLLDTTRKTEAEITGDNIKRILRKYVMMYWITLAKDRDPVLLWTLLRISCSKKERKAIYWPAEQLLASQEGICCMESLQDEVERRY